MSDKQTEFGQYAGTGGKDTGTAPTAESDAADQGVTISVDTSPGKGQGGAGN